MNIEMREKIFVTKSFMPAKEEYFKYIDKIYENGLLTNQGPLLKDFEAKKAMISSVYRNIKAQSAMRDFETYLNSQCVLTIQK